MIVIKQQSTTTFLKAVNFLCLYTRCALRHFVRKPPTNLRHPKLVLGKKQLRMKEIQVFRARWLISDKRAAPTAASGSRNPNHHCVPLMYLFWSTTRSRLCHSLFVDIWETQRERTQRWQQERLPGPSVPDWSSNTAIAAELQVGAGGVFSRLVPGQSSKPTACLFFLQDAADRLTEAEKN